MNDVSFKEDNKINIPNSNKFNINLIEENLKGLEPGELLIMPPLSRINIYGNYNIMNAYAYLSRLYEERDLLMARKLKSMPLNKDYIIHEGNKLMEHMALRSVTDKIKDDIDMLIHQVLGDEYIERRRYPKPLMSSIYLTNDQNCIFGCNKIKL